MKWCVPLNRILSFLRKQKRQINFYEKQINDILFGMRKLPDAEKQYITLKRDLEVNQKVYGFLLQTKLEASSPVHQLFLLQE